MLIRFNIKNFLSFSETKEGKSIEFSMIAGKVRNKKEHVADDGKLRLLKLAAIYGANASGKSNLVKAIQFMKHVVLGGLPQGHLSQFCKIDGSNKDKPSYFEVEVKLRDKYYAYGFEVILSTGSFVSEWLVELSTDDRKDKVIFERDIQNKKSFVSKNIKDSTLRKKLELYAEDIRGDVEVLFLQVMNQNKASLYEEESEISIYKKLFDWFDECLDINYPDRPISDYSYMANTQNAEEIKELISAFGTGISDFKLVDIPIEKVIANLPASVKVDIISQLEKNIALIERMKKDNIKSIEFTMVVRDRSNFFVITADKNGEPICKTIKFIHESKDTFFDIYEESDGTIRLLDLLEVLLSKENKTYVIDELDRCLHPSLTYKFISLFLDFAAKKNIQLIVTTHESRLLDFDLLRRDEVWFINKNTSGESEVYSLEEYNTRFDKKIDKAYLEGRYGGVPIFNTFFPIENEV